jgi:hypothetical protein
VDLGPFRQAIYDFGMKGRQEGMLKGILDPEFDSFNQFCDGAGMMAPDMVRRPLHESCWH